MKSSHKKTRWAIIFPICSNQWDPTTSMLCCCQCFASTDWDKGYEEKKSAGDYYKQLGSVQQHLSAEDQHSFSHAALTMWPTLFSHSLVKMRNYLFICCVKTHKDTHTPACVEANQITGAITFVWGFDIGCTWTESAESGHKRIKFQHYKSELDQLAKVLNTIVHSQIVFYLTRDDVISKLYLADWVNMCEQTFQSLA